MIDLTKQEIQIIIQGLDVAVQTVRAMGLQWTPLAENLTKQLVFKLELELYDLNAMETGNE